MIEQAAIDFPALDDPACLCAGTDEVGRGPLAGDVVAAAVILERGATISGLNDSKKLTHKQRLLCADVIKAEARAWCVARASVEEIDELNILHASLLAMKRAVEGLALDPDFVFVDGKFCPQWQYRSQAVVKGDSRIPAIAAASILAKVTRDEEMAAFESLYPGYGFAQHKGYPTAKHLEALRERGPCVIHRRSFAPVAALLDEQS